MDILFELGVVIVVGAIFAYIARLLKQPMIPAYILSGVLLGPILGYIPRDSYVKYLSEIGIAFLLFIVGLEINLDKLKDVIWISTVGAILQMILVFAFGYIISNLLGFNVLVSVYFGLMVAFSSTMIVIKLLADKNQIDSLHARMTLGILLMQDIIAIVVLLMMDSVNGAGFAVLFWQISKGLAIIAIAYILSKLIIPKIFNFAAKNQELLFILSISFVLVFGLGFQMMGYSLAIGAFIAGVLLGNLDYSLEISSKIKNLRDFFAVIFFVSLGLDLYVNDWSLVILPVIVFFLIVVIIKPLVIMFLCSIFNYTKKPSFYVSMYLAQVSEFSLILFYQGLKKGHVTNDAFSIVVLLTILTIIYTSYFAKFDSKMFSLMHNWLKPFEKLIRKTDVEGEIDVRKYKPAVILVGYNRIGFSVLKKLRRSKKRVLVVDFNPEVIHKLKEKNVKAIYGDMADIETLHELPFDKVKMIISTVPDHDDNLRLMKYVRKVNSKAIVILTSNFPSEGLDLYKKGADYVILPHLLGGEHIGLLIDEFKNDPEKLKLRKDLQLKILKKRSK